MSTVSGRPDSEPQPSHEPKWFRYGWRYVRTTRPDGTEGFDQVPLTLEDVLHPELGDTIPEGNAHDDDLSYLKSVFRVQLRDDPTAVVLSRCLVDFNIPDVKRLARDIAVFLGVRRRNGWSSFDVAEEGARAALLARRVEPDESGRVWLEPVGLWLGQTRDRRGGYMVLACFDPVTGKAIGDYTAISHALAESRKRLADESRRVAQPE